MCKHHFSHHHVRDNGIRRVASTVMLLRPRRCKCPAYRKVSPCGKCNIVAQKMRVSLSRQKRLQARRHTAADRRRSRHRRTTPTTTSSILSPIITFQVIIRPLSAFHFQFTRATPAGAALPRANENVRAAGEGVPLNIPRRARIGNDKPPRGSRCCRVGASRESRKGTAPPSPPCCHQRNNARMAGYSRWRHSIYDKHIIDI